MVNYDDLEIRYNPMVIGTSGFILISNGHTCVIEYKIKRIFENVKSDMDIITKSLIKLDEIVANSKSSIAASIVLENGMFSVNKFKEI